MSLSLITQSLANGRQGDNFSFPVVTEKWKVNPEGDGERSIRRRCGVGCGGDE